MVQSADLFDIIAMRAMRCRKSDPVPEALIRRILEAGQCAPKGGTRSTGASSSSRIPVGKFGAVRRGPLHDIVYQNRQGQAWEDAGEAA